MNILKTISVLEKLEIIFNIQEKACIISLDGRLLQEKNSAINYICKSFQIERRVTNWAGLRDVLSDSYWISNDVIYVFLTNQQLIFHDNLNFRQILLTIFSDTIDWWNGDVEKYVIGGKKKSFHVYLVDC
ncbi:MULTISPECIES: hypothetical protein [unclassified Streptococcus]|uniref:barstar family protein n=1 Tax=unclassified Streptococcus TaxID=2608887 RepID=UPI0010720A7E|nr:MULTISPECIES: hypothetical protein [unclassified Streptococcus]MBF0786852.1 hypothetical protein [Streptococcus sp. 19428wC2_LYSM12]MCQ9212737.1 hypothetical protein [Streptococcus sp. B01]MCQ9214078.1 hypothetical protein [Streptococcus sp. O1]TFV06222.1 hypothetical protein E4T79_02845 [Streptococcus sp. LYSM12]